MISSFQSMDVGVLMAVQDLRCSALDPLVQSYTSLGNYGALWLVLSGCLLCVERTRLAGVLAIAAMLLGLIWTNLILKPLVTRPRPWLHVEGLIPLIEEWDPNSFPSGHTCAAFASAMMFWRAMPETWTWVKILTVSMAVLMGLSRLYVGVHYPSDILAGALVGFACAELVWRIYLMRS